jgi:hypothetical protein
VFIDKYLEALGYTDLGDVQHGVPVDAGTFADYVVNVNGKAAIVIEAKKLGASLGPKRGRPGGRVLRELRCQVGCCDGRPLLQALRRSRRRSSRRAAD